MRLNTSNLDLVIKKDFGSRKLSLNNQITTKKFSFNYTQSYPKFWVHIFNIGTYFQIISISFCYVEGRGLHLHKDVQTDRMIWKWSLNSLNVIFRNIKICHNLFSTPYHFYFFFQNKNHILIILISHFFNVILIRWCTFNTKT